MSEFRSVRGKFRRVWAKAFWGFDPENESFLGFTRLGDHERLLSQLKLGDIVLIYGTLRRAERDDKGNVLGFLEILPKYVHASERMSESTATWRRRDQLTKKWNHAFPVVRAWRVTPGQDRDIRKIASKTLTPANAQHMATRGMLLTEREARKALALQVAETPVFLSEDKPSNVTPVFVDGFVPTKGFPASTGRRIAVIEDGPCRCYLMRWTGNAADMLDGKQIGDVSECAIAKIGMSKNPTERCTGLNASLPPAGRLKWTVVAESAPYASIRAAARVEDELKRTFDKKFHSLGGEFFAGDLNAMGKAFLTLTRHAKRRRGR